MKQSSKSALWPLWADYFCIHIDYRFILLKTKALTLPCTKAEENYEIHIFTIYYE